MHYICNIAGQGTFSACSTTVNTIAPYIQVTAGGLILFSTAYATIKIITCQRRIKLHREESELPLTQSSARQSVQRNITCTEAFDPAAILILSIFLAAVSTSLATISTEYKCHQLQNATYDYCMSLIYSVNLLNASRHE